MSISNVDDLLFSQPEMLSESPAPKDLPETSTENQDPDNSSQPLYDTESTKEPEATQQDSQEEPKGDAAFDDYGSEIPKGEKLIPQSEVERMMRERRAREKNEYERKIQQQEYELQQYRLQQTHQQNNEPQQDYQSGEQWESELRTFIAKTNEELKIAEQEKAWRQQEAEIQSQFEVRFNQGAARYADFESVVMNKPITPQMALATRGMQDPAAFIYAAAKTQAPELDRISKIIDPYAQAIELGRLEERMRKSRHAASGAPKPITHVNSDISDKKSVKRGIDDLIVEQERQEIARRNRR